MKKYIIIVTAILSFFLFYSSYTQISLNDYAYAQYINTNIAHNSNLKESQITFTVRNEDKQQFLDELNGFLDSHTYTASVILSEKLSYFNKQIDNYLYTKDKDLTEKLYTISENEYLDFSVKTNAYYTSDLLDDNSNNHIIFLNKTYNEKYNNVINIKPLKQISIDKLFNTNSISLSFYAENIEQFKSDISSSFLSQFFDINTITSDNNNAHFEIKDNTISFQAVWVLIVSFLLISICILFQLRKEIMIRKMQGENNLRVTSKLFLKYLIRVNLMFILIHVVSYLFFVGNINLDFINLIKNLFNNCCLFFISIGVIFIIIYILIYNMKNVSLLKKSKTNIKVLFTYGVLKIVAMLILVAPLLANVSSTYNDVKLYQFQNNETSRFAKQLYVEGISSGEDHEKFEAIKNKLLIYFEEHGGYYQNFEYNVVAQSLTNVNKINLPLIEVNTNYLCEYELYDINSRKIDISKLNNNTLLIPEKYQAEVVQNIDFEKKIIIKNGNKFTRKDIPVDANTIHIEDPLIKVFKGNNWETNLGFGPLFNILPINSNADISAFEEFMDNENIRDLVSISQYSDDLKVIQYQEENRMVISMMSIVLYLITIIIVSYSTIFMFISQNRKVYAARYFLGFSYFSRYIGIMIFNIFTYLILLCTSLIFFNIDKLLILSFILVVAIFEYLSFYILIKKYQKNDLTKSLKGE